MEKQITKVQALELAMVVIDKAIEDKTFLDTDYFDKVDIDLLEKIEAMKEQEIKVASRKRTTESKTSKAMTEDKEKIIVALQELQTDDFLSGAEIAEIAGLVDYTSQKITARMTALVKDGLLEKGKATSDKKKVGYKLVVTEI